VSTSAGAVPRPLATVAQEAATCTLCALHEGRTQVVFGEGSTKAGLLLVGDAPGRHEDLTGRPFVGATGNLLENLLSDAGVSRADVYLTTVVKCRPTQGERPPAASIEACAPYLRAQIAAIRPRAILALGPLPTRLLLMRDVSVTQIAGYRLPFHGSTLIATHDPADALRGSPPAMAALRRDIATAKGVAEGTIPPADESLVALLDPRASDRRRQARGGASGR
jgi:uracil-DNA glycosylase